MDVGKKIRKLREKRGLEQLELARKVGISQSKMNKIETGFQKRLESDVLVSISEALNVTTDYLLGRELKEVDLLYYKNKIANEFPDIDLMFKDMESLTAEEMKDVYEYIKFKMSQKNN